MSLLGADPEANMAALSMTLANAEFDQLMAVNLAADSDEQRLMEEKILNELCADRDRYGEFSEGQHSTDTVDDLFYNTRGLGYLMIHNI